MQIYYIFIIVNIYQMYLNSSLLCKAYEGRSAIFDGILYPPGPGLGEPLIGSL